MSYLYRHQQIVNDTDFIYLSMLPIQIARNSFYVTET